MSNWHKTWLFYKHNTNNNCDFLEKYIGNQKLIYEEFIQHTNDIINTDLVINNDYTDIIEKLKNNSLITTRIGCVESKFLINYHFKKPFEDHNVVVSYDDDTYMKRNAGLYYKNEEDKKRVLTWWCNNTVECINKSTLTSCICVIHYDLTLWSLLNLKGVFYNWGHVHKVILKNSENKKILYIGNGVKSIEYAFNTGIQNKWNFPVSNFSMYYYKTPQTTLNMEYPDETMIETTNKIVNDIIELYPDFDTAVFGCGAYGPPISNILSKRLGNKNFIYLGSKCYTMFGLYSNGIPCDDPEAIRENWVEIIEECDPSCRGIDGGKYWKT